MAGTATSQSRADQMEWKAISATEAYVHCAALIKAFSILWLR